MWVRPELNWIVIPMASHRQKGWINTRKCRRKEKTEWDSSLERWEGTSGTIEDCARVLPVPGKAGGIHTPANYPSRHRVGSSCQGWISSGFDRYISFFTSSLVQTGASSAANITGRYKSNNERNVKSHCRQSSLCVNYYWTRIIWCSYAYIWYNASTVSELRLMG